MNKLPLLFLTAAIYLGFFGSIYGSADASAEAPPGSSLSGQALKKETEELIVRLKAEKKKQEDAKQDTTEIEANIKSAETNLVVNNDRHTLHDASKKFAEAIGIISKKLEESIQENNKNIETQLKVAEKNAQVIQLLQPKKKDDDSSRASESKSTNNGPETDKDDDDE